VGTAGFLGKALYTAALIAYARCFGTGKRKTKLDESIFAGDAAHLLERHRYWKNTRDKHLAHSVNAFELMHAAACIQGLATDEPDVQEVGATYLVRSVDHVDDIRWLVKLATYAQTIAYGRMDRANKRLDQQVRALPKDKLKKLKPLVIYPAMGPEAAATPRE
jgi:hypothetical protein